MGDRVSDIQGRSIVVTGGADGIGLACVEEFARQGANVTVGDIKLPPSDKLDALGALPGTVRYVNCDVRDRDQVKALADAAAENFGGIQSVFANTGSRATARSNRAARRTGTGSSPST